MKTDIRLCDFHLDVLSLWSGRI